MDVAIGTARVEDGRTVGQRVVHSHVLDKTRSLMNSLGEQDTVLAIDRWLVGPGKVPGRTVLEQALQQTEAHRQEFLNDQDMWRDAAYCEIAAFCVQSCLDEAGAT